MAVERNRVTQLTIVGDAFAKPILAALDEAKAAGASHDITSLKIVLSSGVMWSKETKVALLDWCSATLADSLGSSEGVGFATSVSRRDVPARTARFTLGPNAQVFTEDGRPVQPGTNEARTAGCWGTDPGRLLQGPGQERRDVREFDGRTWSVPATTRPSRRTARSICSDEARPASTRLVKRSTPKRLRRP